MSVQEPTPELELPPGAATRDYARDSLVPFQPLVTQPAEELTEDTPPALQGRSVTWTVIGLVLFGAAVAIGFGSVLLG